ncbi:hypothetical protein [Flavobacterium sp.]|uniref:hypothetical protein n=1 Tax=Flavobacterium sp. TaxID=239 RepID=UPI0035285E6A
MFKFSLYIVVVLFFASCNYFTTAKEPEAVARVGSTFLYKNDIQNLVPKGTSAKDSVAIIQTYIKNWATKILLLDAAEVNLNSDKVSEYNRLIEDYKTDLFTKGYLEQMVIRTVDTTVTNEQISTYYQQNKQYFKNANELVKLRYVNLVKENPNIEKIRSQLTSFTKKDKNELNDLSIQFKSYALNDSVWVDVNQVFEKIPVINLENKSQYISRANSFQISDSTSVWLVKIVDVLPENAPTPLQFLKPTIKQIIVNKRKLELVKKIETEITNDAIKDEKFEIYN